MASIINFFFGSQNKLKGRECHRAVAVRDSLYLWGGKMVGQNLTADDLTVKHFPLSTGIWTTKNATGKRPFVPLGYVCRVIADKIYFFGGGITINSKDSSKDLFFNNINMLDTSTHEWKELQPNNPDIPVMRRTNGGMISFEGNGEHHLLMIGGIGHAPAEHLQIANAKYSSCDDDVMIDASTKFCTNESSLYNISSGHWCCAPPLAIGECMEPAWDFVMEQINNNRAVVFGGRAKYKVDVKNDIYLLTILSAKEILWQCLKARPLDQWPIKRYYAGAAMMITSIGDPVLVITGGADQDDTIINDCWLFNTKNQSWTELTDVPQAFRERVNSSLSAFVMSPHCVWLVTTGGIYPGAMNRDTMILELVNDTDQWKVGSILDCTDKMYQSLYKSFHLLQISEKQQEIQRLTEDFHQRQNEMEREVQRSQQMEREVNQQLQQMEREVQRLQLIEREVQRLQQMEREVHQQLQQMERGLEANKEVWVIDMNEVDVTEEELGKGSYGSVKVGIFRGLRVAVKSLHAIIISDYNLDSFTREMYIASQIRHPNLVQFLGATAKNTASPLILTELMATSLHSVLKKTKVQMEKQQFCSISQDIALGLNYLHLFKPQPIVHRDISSPNILLKPCTGPAGYEAKVADYGTAKVLHSASSGTIMPGNPAYAAPEARDPDKHSPAMDVYSYSVLLMEMSLCKAPELTVAERKKQAAKVSPESLKNLVERGLSESENRPTMSMILEFFAEL